MSAKSSFSVAWQWLLSAGLVAAVVLMLLWLAGLFHTKVPTAAAAQAGRAAGERPTAAARLVEIPRIESAVGTIRPVHETAVASKLLARVVEISVQAGQAVKSGDVLVRLDDEDLRARLDQAEAAQEAADARRAQARIELERVQRLIETNAAARIELDRAETAMRAAEAEYQQARQARREAETILQYATIRSPIDGQVIDRRVEAGDTVSPGQVLLTLFDPTRMQLIASVRESLTQRLAVGQTIDVQIDAIDLRCGGRVSEIVPEAQSTSRTFSVKVTGPCPPGVYSGMFGRLLIPLDNEQVLVIPRSAVRSVGQLTLVDVVEGGRLKRRAVQLGREFDELPGDPAGPQAEVLAGLRAGEQVALPEVTK